MKLNFLKFLQNSIKHYPHNLSLNISLKEKIRSIDDEIKESGGEERR